VTDTCDPMTEYWIHPIYLWRRIEENYGKDWEMLIPELSAALTVALILSALFALATKKRGIRKGLFWLFLILFLATWSGGVWVKPFGPVLWGVHWLSFLVVGAVVALILAVGQSKSEPKPQGRQETIEMLEKMKEERQLEEVTWVTLTIFFWVLVLALLIAIVFRYAM
jgi:Ca2+/Na+ antiporter